MVVDCPTWRIEQVIPSETGAGKRVLEEVLAQLTSHCWGQRDIFGVHLAMEEALVNAIKHGNRCDITKTVHVVCELWPKRLHVQIRDEGPGFDPNKVPDCTDDDRIEMPCGRGVLLMRSFMSTVEFNGKGNCVFMTKNRARDEDAA